MIKHTINLFKPDICEISKHFHEFVCTLLSMGLGAQVVQSGCVWIVGLSENKIGTHLTLSCAADHYRRALCWQLLFHGNTHRRLSLQVRRKLSLDFNYKLALQKD